MSCHMSQWRITFIICLSVFDSNCGMLSALHRIPFFHQRLPKHTPYPKVQDETTLQEIILGLGLKYEAHTVVTADGYILTLSRIGYPQWVDTDQQKRGPPVLMVNGLMMQSEAWLVQGNPRHNAAIALLEAGYDIWLGDQRGTLRSRKHIVYSDKQSMYWDFTFHEVGVYDLPAFMDYILAATGYPKLLYMGLSLGSTFYFVMCSELPHYQEKLLGTVQFVPVGTVPTIFQLSIKTQTTLIILNTLLSLYLRFQAPYIKKLQDFKENMISKKCKASTDTWINAVAFTIGYGGQYEKKIFCDQITTIFGGTSLITVLHTIQLYKNGKFQRYDYGIIENLLKYRQIEPPSYDLRQVWAPTAVYYSDIDDLAPPESVEKMMDTFSGATYRCVMKGLTHVGVALDARFQFYLKDLVELVDSMTGRTNITKALSGTCRRY